MTLQASGRWIENGLIWKQGGSRYLPKKCLKNRYPSVHPKRWENWAKQSCPHINPHLNKGRIRSLKVYDPTKGLVLVHLERDVEEVVRRLRESESRATGKWLSLYEIWQEGGSIWFTTKYLAEKYERSKDIHFSYWHNWAKKSCRYLDPGTNGGRIRSKKLPRKRNHPVRVFLQEDVDRIIERRADAAGSRTDPAGKGRWVGGVFELTKPVPELNLPAGELMLRAEAFREHVGMSTTSPLSRWHNRGHSALDPNVNGGCVRFIVVPLPARQRINRLKGGPTNVRVSSRTDADLIREWQQRHIDQAGDSDGRKGETLAGVAKAIRLDATKTSDLFLLSIALREFRNETPADAWRATRIQNGRPYSTWKFDVTAFKKWLSGRTIEDVAEAVRREETPRNRLRRHKRERRAILFLQFALTRGSFSQMQFGRFAANPPVGQLLEPCSEVPAEDVLTWAEKAKIPAEWVSAAKKKLPFKWRQDGMTGKSYWRLTEPIVISPEAAGRGPRVAAVAHNQTAASTASSTNGAPASALSNSRPEIKTTQHGGRPRSEKTAEVYRFCYENFPTSKRQTIMAKARALYGNLAPKEPSHVTLFAKRHAKAMNLPMPTKAQIVQ